MTSKAFETNIELNPPEGGGARTGQQFQVGLTWPRR